LPADWKIVWELFLLQTTLLLLCVQILQQVPNNYETDLIYPIVAAAAKLAGLNYRTADARQQTSLKVCHHSSSQLSLLPHK